MFLGNMPASCTGTSQNNLGFLIFKSFAIHPTVKTRGFSGETLINFDALQH